MSSLSSGIGDSEEEEEEREKAFFIITLFALNPIDRRTFHLSFC